MNELQFGNMIRQILTRGTRLDAPILERLRVARSRALAAQRLEPVPALAAAGSTLGTLGGITGLSLRVLIPGALLVGGLLGIHSWQQHQRAAEVVEIDARILTDTLPIDAYIDKGFEVWLKKQASG